MRDELLPLPEVARQLSCSVATVKRRIRSGELPAYRDGRRLVRVRALDLDRYIGERVTRGRSGTRSWAGVTLRANERLWD
jgi:excisionase family DNA binding protein